MAGMREIRRLRQELEARDGDRFDLTGFHDELIGHGSLPLATLAGRAAGLGQRPRLWHRLRLSKPIPSASIAWRNGPRRPSFASDGDHRRGA